MTPQSVGRCLEHLKSMLPLVILKNQVYVSIKTSCSVNDDKMCYFKSYPSLTAAK